MKVTALREGFYGGALRLPGAVFEIKDKSELGSWMGDEKGNPIEGAKGKSVSKTASAEATVAQKLAKLKADLETARTKGDEKGIAHIAGEIAKLDPEAAKAAQLEQLKTELATAEAADKKDEKEINRLKGEIEKLEPSSDLT